jgi:hypothetical protein
MDSLGGPTLSPEQAKGGTAKKQKAKGKGKGKGKSKRQKAKSKGKSKKQKAKSKKRPFPMLSVKLLGENPAPNSQARRP